MNRLFLGIGCPDMGDNSIGVHVVEKLKLTLPAGYYAVCSTGDPGDIMEFLKNYSNVSLIGPISSGLVPGTTLRINLAKEDIPEQLNVFSAHAFSLPQTIKLARKLKKLPETIDFIGIETGTSVKGTILSSALKKASGELVREILDECCRQSAKVSS